MSSQSVSSQSERVPALITTGLVVVSVVFPLLSLICVLLRYSARRSSQAPLLADDWWIAASWVFSLFLSIDVWVAGAIGGIDYYKINELEGIENSVIALCVSGVVAQVALTLVKIGVLLFYKRLFPIRKFKICVWIGIVITACWGIAIFFLLIFQGNTVKGTFRGTAVWVVDTTQLGLAQAWSSIVLDVLILCYPLPMIFNLQMKTNRKIALAMIFWLGLFCCVSAAIRLVLVKENIEKVSGSAGMRIHAEYKEIMFVIIEPNCSIIAACLPCYGPLLRGGRALESVLKSVRSMLSLKSLRSTTRVSSPSTSQANAAPLAKTDSQLELNYYKHVWPQTHHSTEVGISSTPSGSFSIHNFKGVTIPGEPEIPSGQVKVTKGISISSV